MLGKLFLNTACKPEGARGGGDISEVFVAHLRELLHPAACQRRVFGKAGAPRAFEHFADHDRFKPLSGFAQFETLAVETLLR